MKTISLIAWCLFLSIPCFSQSTNSDQNDIFVFVEQMPEFPGGDDALNRFLTSNIHYPKSALKNNISGTVYVNFIISADGTIQNVKVTKGVHKTLDEEAIRVVKKMPKWKPGKQAGQNVSVYFDVPIHFEIN